VRRVTRRAFTAFRLPPGSSIFAPHKPYSVPHLRGSPMTKGRWHGSSVRNRLHLDPALEESAITERLERFHALLTKDPRAP